jgi:hypothetical protein
MAVLRSLTGIGVCCCLLWAEGSMLAQGDRYLLAEGTDVRLTFADGFSSKTSAVGDPVTLLLDEELKVGEVVVARVGAKALGEITNAKKAGMVGKGGELNMRLQYLKVGDNRIKLRGSKGQEGEGKGGSVVALTVFLGPIGLIKKGRNVDIKEGSSLKAYVAEDISLPASIAKLPPTR